MPETMLPKFIYRHVTTEKEVMIIDVVDDWVIYNKLKENKEYMKPVYVFKAMYRRYRVEIGIN